ncbi:ankyrin repeat protein [Elusimicrobium simillimum]|uniref:ankyrin repeat domain-containing protein n=1 Tax=Elusimicrobium simillimum TaxID=3143438 RepID=UPI003C6F4464
MKKIFFIFLAAAAGIAIFLGAALFFITAEWKEFPDYCPNSPLAHAVYDNDLNTLAELLKNQKTLKSINTPDACGNPPLDVAIQQGNIEIVKELLSANAEVNLVYGQNKITPLHAAAGWNGNNKEELNIIEILLQAGATIEVADAYGFTPLHEAASNADSGKIKLLLEYGANPNAQTTRRRTPLHLAAQMVGSREGPAAIGLLISNGADTRVKDENGELALDIATRNLTPQTDAKAAIKLLTP